MWHSTDLLARLARGEVIGASSQHENHGAVERREPSSIEFGSLSLALTVGDASRHERLATTRSAAFEDRDLVVFAARAKSIWALDALVGRYTGGAYSWDVFRRTLTSGIEEHIRHEPILRAVTLERLYDICEVLHERNMDISAERALLALIASRLIAGERFPETPLAQLVERLLQVGDAASARVLVERLEARTWLRHAFETELAHPKHGGSFEAMLALMNVPYRQLGLELVELSVEGDTPFQALDAVPLSAKADGPLVTVIMTCWQPGAGISTSVRSIIAQTYQNWELVIMDDASPSDFDETLERVAAADPRIRVVRSAVNAGTYVRRNEAIQSANGEFVTMQDSDDWSHPRRLEVQVQDLLSHPDRLANTVYAARVTTDFSVVSARGAKLFVSEPSLMFRRAPVVSAVGFYDSIRKSADTEFRKRLEASTEQPIPVLLPAAPLQLMLADESSLSGGDFGTNIWNHPDRLTYWSATGRHLRRIEAGEQDAFLPFPLTTRVFHAPATWAPVTAPAREFDVLVVLDGRASAGRKEFHRTVARELVDAAEAGLRVAVLQSDSLGGPRGLAFFTEEIQALVDDAIITRVGAHDAVRAECTVIRHAGSAQGHAVDRWAVVSSRVVIIEDESAGDTRGVTIAQADVLETVAGWFAVAPVWTVAPPVLPIPEVSAVVLDDETIRVALTARALNEIGRVRLCQGEREVSFEVKQHMSQMLVVVGATSEMLDGPWQVVAEYAIDGTHVSQRCDISPGAVIWNRTGRSTLQSENDSLIVSSPGASDNRPNIADFVASSLSTVVGAIEVVGEEVRLTIAGNGADFLRTVYAVRDVDGSVIRRRDFSSASTDASERVWQRSLAKFAGTRWHIIGGFATPFGYVERPIEINSNCLVVGTERWKPQTLQGGRVLIEPPQPNIVLRTVGRITRGVRSRLAAFLPKSAITTVFEPILRRRTERRRIEFDSRHSAPRVALAPRVSVIMPVYNVEPYLDEAIRSVLGQELKDIELIIVDDASTDGGRRIIGKHWRKDHRVRVIALDHNTLGGAGIPSNIGIRASRGTYIAFADSDDHVTKAGLTVLVELADAHGAELSIGDFRTFTENLREGNRPYDHAAWNTLPRNQPISAITHPALIQLSPVPWRKLYRRDFLEANGILYPEGDYFYEDNPLHWFVLSRAHRVVVCDEVISFHRQEREGQTMSAQSYKLGAFVNHANTVLNFIESSENKDRASLYESFYLYLDRASWTVKSQTQPISASLIRRGLGELFIRAQRNAPAVHIPPEVRATLSTHRYAYPDVDLTVVIPVYNSGDLLAETVDSVLKLTGVRFNVLIVDDGSTDGSLDIARQYERKFANVHVFAQGNRGAGRARNSVIPLCTGRYTFFLDADDIVDAGALSRAVRASDASAADLLFMKYRIEYADEGRLRSMFESDQKIWNSLAAASTNAKKQASLAQMINYPWNRIIRTSLLHDSNIFFGSTIVHNDVMFHWHSIVSAQNIAYIDEEVCVHRKFATRQQVTNISDERRMAVLEALRATHERIVHVDGYDNVKDAWYVFSSHLLEWARERVPAPLLPKYDERSAKLITVME